MSRLHSRWLDDDVEAWQDDVGQIGTNWCGWRGCFPSFLSQGALPGTKISLSVLDLSLNAPPEMIWIDRPPAPEAADLFETKRFGLMERPEVPG